MEYSGYRVPHPLVFDVHVKVETMNSRAGPIKVFETALDDLGLEVERMQKKFEVSKLYDDIPCSALIVNYVILFSGSNGPSRAVNSETLPPYFQLHYRWF